MLKEQFQKALDSIQNDLTDPSSENNTTDIQAVLVAYSGGMDSHVLLHLCVELNLDVRAVYINHGLMQEANQWQQHCQSVCKRSTRSPAAPRR